MYRILFISIIFITGVCSAGSLRSSNQVREEKTTLTTNAAGKGQEIVIDFTKGKEFYYPLFAVWIEDTDGKYIQTLYVAKSVATGIFEYGKQERDKWIKAPLTPVLKFLMLIPVRLPGRDSC